MSNENYVEGARKRKEAREQVSATVDDFLAERKEKIANYVPKELKSRQLGVGLYELYFPDGGEVSVDYSGLFTSMREVNKAIAQYNFKCHDKLQ